MIIEFKTAKLAFEKGFDWECEYIKSSDFPEIRKHSIDYSGEKEFSIADCGKLHPTGTVKHYLAPTQARLAKWLRESYKLWVWVAPDKFNRRDLATYYIESADRSIIISPHSEPRYKDWKMANNSYESAMEKGLIAALKLIVN